MSRYEYDTRRPTRRLDDSGPSGCASAFAGLLVVAIFIGIVVAFVMQAKEDSKAQPKMSHDSMTVVHTYNGETIRFYVMTDPDTQVQYIVSDRGGICVREGNDEN